MSYEYDGDYQDTGGDDLFSVRLMLNSILKILHLPLWVNILKIEVSQPQL